MVGVLVRGWGGIVVMARGERARCICTSAPHGPCTKLCVFLRAWMPCLPLLFFCVPGCPASLCFPRQLHHGLQDRHDSYSADDLATNRRVGLHPSTTIVDKTPPAQAAGATADASAKAPVFTAIDEGVSVSAESLPRTKISVGKQQLTVTSAVRFATTPSALPPPAEGVCRPLKCCVCAADLTAVPGPKLDTSRRETESASDEALSTRDGYSCAVCNVSQTLPLRSIALIS